MSNLHSKKEYEAIKNQHKALAREKEVKIKQDLARLLSDATPRFIREKLVMSCLVFGSVYLAEELLVRKKVPGIVKFAVAVSATAFAPKIYRALYRKFQHPDSHLPPNTSPNEPALDGYSSQMVTPDTARTPPSFE